MWGLGKEWPEMRQREECRGKDSFLRFLMTTVPVNAES